VDGPWTSLRERVDKGWTTPSLALLRSLAMGLPTPCPHLSTARPHCAGDGERLGKVFNKKNFFLFFQERQIDRGEEKV